MTREFGCQICSHVLNRRADEHGLAVYEHPLILGLVDHRPVPVPAERLTGLRRLCDFCGSGSDPLLFVYRTHPISALAVGAGVEHVEYYGTRWSACDMCSHWLTVGDAGRLLDRAATGSGLRRDAAGLAITGHLQRVVLDSLLPGRVLITTGRWPSAAPAARLLPKVRDRLAALLRGPDHIDTPPLEPVRHDLASGLDQARLYYVDAHFSQMVQHATAALPPTTAAAALAPADHGLLTWAEPVAGAAAASWTAGPDGWEVVEYAGLGAEGRPDEAVQHLRAAVGWLMPIRTSHLRRGQLAAGSHPAAALLTTWLLIGQQSVADVAPAEVDPAIRKAYQRARRPAPDVRLIRIRGTAAVRPPAASAAHGEQVRTHRWWTSGHWRNQAHGPGRALRKPVYISPFLKGPADLPIRHSTTVRVLGRTGADTDGPTGTAAP
ncbi:hypothetical protein ACFQY4_18165 [Catellatospora bangladeshensis]|uniref:Uncharacterized protein n=1 Tax=Catellatospora bangladeshensis TaxID=310355 RepID=A0A8J3JRU6_9ACTN|nr:hypothetical protein [Catellatospora bangladeshensis]GIF82059.1 hypothetical protein Cba03nite_34080 [Catellatospora bangladeshensis]